MLWFAFNLLSLTYWKQLIRVKPLLTLCCDLLSIYYLWHTENNKQRLQTSGNQLWFAFNLLSLTYWKQPLLPDFQCGIRCDLLSIYYLWHTENNSVARKMKEDIVVICFQSIIFDILKTTERIPWKPLFSLWFAFNLLSLTYWKQQLIVHCYTEHVVICFQSIIFDILKTTFSLSIKLFFALWFAFNLLSLTYWKQRLFRRMGSGRRCDLLSIYYLWHTENNTTPKTPWSIPVVICFQSIIFDILKTTERFHQSLVRLLWFAFNLLSLTYWKQL